MGKFVQAKCQYAMPLPLGGLPVLGHVWCPRQWAPCQALIDAPSVCSVSCHHKQESQTWRRWRLC